jgi:hypothetical protein
MMDEPSDQTELRQGKMFPPATIRYVGIGQLTVYLVSEEELRRIENGGSSSTYLNLAILFVGVGGSFLSSLLLSEPKSLHRYVVVIVITVGTLLAGSILFLLWHRSSKEAKSVIQGIRQRAGLPTNEIVVDVDGENQVNE